jgi:hypothetical protein
MDLVVVEEEADTHRFIDPAVRAPPQVKSSQMVFDGNAAGRPASGTDQVFVAGASIGAALREHIIKFSRYERKMQIEAGSLHRPVNC